MAEYLVVRLSMAATNATTWQAVDDSGALIGPPGRGELSELAAIAGGRRLIALVPASQVLRTRVELPAKGQAKLLQLLPFALEEQLADDVESLHFALGKRDADDGSLPVAAVNRELLSEWRNRLTDAGLDVTAIYAESDGLGDMPGTAILFVEPEQSCLADAQGELSTADADTLGALLELWLAGQLEDHPPNLFVYAAGNVASELEHLESLRPRLASLEVKTLNDGAIARMAATVATQPGVNLLQGEFARRSDLARFWPAWRLAAALLVTVGVTAFGALAAESWLMNKRADSLQAAVQAAFRYTFPDARQVTGTRAELQSRLRAIGQTSGGQAEGAFLDSLQAVAGALSDGDADIEGIDYRGGVMELRMRVRNVETLDRIQRSIDERAGLTAEIQSANADDGKVLGRLRISEAGA